ncbi:hypothetical protein [Micromonospora globbae]|uniref:hypothetical protein n=1 Tax=Micromonospora globbae TaxID=1894969 RepID=UPI00386F7ECE|nr:hypothetical protein OH732_13820 [Micromonospora globbae]
MQHCRISFMKRTAVGALLLVLAVAGCGSEAESSSDATWSSPDTAATATASRAASSPSPRDAEPSASSSPTVDESREVEAPQKPQTTQKPKAAQETEVPSGGGTKYAACADGDCTVSFSGSVEFPLAGWTVSSSVEDGGVRVRLTRANGMGGGGGFMAGPGCSVAIHADGGGRVGCDQPGAEPEPGGWVVHLLELDGRTAVIRAILG